MSRWPELVTAPAVRRLRTKEVDEIYQALQERGNVGFPSRGKFLEVLNGNWNSELRPKLEMVELTTQPVGGLSALERLKADIVSRWIEARGEAGTSAGGLAADAVSQTHMQNTLKSFHRAGAQSLGSGSEAGMEVVGLARDRQNSLSRVFLREELDFLDTYSYLQNHKRLQVQNLLIQSNCGLFYDIVGPEHLQMKAWYRGAVAAKITLPPDNWKHAFLLRLDPVLLHQYRITPGEVALLLEQTLNSSDKAELYCLGSPVSEAEVYILVYEDAVILAEAESALTGEWLIPAFLANVAKPRIFACEFPGDRYLADGIVTSALVTSILTGETAEALEGIPGYTWRINKAAIRNGITPRKLGKLLHAANFRLARLSLLNVSQQADMSLEKEGITHVPREGTWLTTPDVNGEPAWLDHLRGMISWRRVVALHVIPPEGVATPQGALRYLEELVQKADRALAEKDQESKEGQARGERAGAERVPILVHKPNPADPLEKFAILGTTWYLSTRQGDIETLLTHPDVDPRFTVSNQFRLNKSKKMKGIAEVLGIMAMRNYVFEEFYEFVTGGGDYIDPQHVALIVDYMTSYGRPIPLTPLGFSLREVGVTDEAYQQKATNTFFMAAFKGVTEPITLATAIALGQPIPQGTGWVLPLVGGLSPQPHEMARPRREAARPTRAAPRAVEDFLRVYAVKPRAQVAPAPAPQLMLPVAPPCIQPVPRPAAQPAPLLNRAAVTAPALAPSRWQR